MQIAVIHNINQENVINHFGNPNREMYYRNEIDKVLEVLKIKGHEVKDFDGDKFLIHNLESFFPAARNGDKPQGIVLNLCYGIQGNSRYTHIPSLLEMMGIPYTGSGPLAHSVALDKELTKRILLQSGIATPEFVLVDKTIDKQWVDELQLTFPLIVKPENEAASFGISVIDEPGQMIQVINETLEEFRQPLLLEEFINGREFNVAILGNDDTLEIFDPVEIDFGESGDRFQSFFGKKQGSYRHICPPDIDDALKHELQDIAQRVFLVLKCSDYARIDFRLDQDEKPNVLELNSMAAIHKQGSFFLAARNAGYDYAGMMDQIIKVASARY